MTRLQIIEEDGQAKAKLDPKLRDDELRLLYRTLVRTRAMDERGMKLQRQGRIGFYLPSTGQEAAYLGAAYALEPTDWIVPSYREPGIPLLRGVSMTKVMNQWFGNAGDSSKGRQMPVHYAFREVGYTSISSPIGTQIVQAAGIAWAMKLKGDPKICMTFFGDGATSSNDFHTGLNFAGVAKAPCLFVCQNNGWAISLPREKQTASESIAIKAKAYGFEGVLVDGNDILAVYAATKQAADRARAGGGPTLLEMQTYRMGPHSTSDDPTKYRPEEEIRHWRSRDPLERFRRYLERKKLWDEGFEKEVAEGAASEAAAAAKEAETAAAVPLASMFEEVYEEVPWHLREQRDLALKQFRDRPLPGHGH